MSKRNRPIEPELVETRRSGQATAAVLDPPESGPPTAEELGQAEPKLKEDVDHGSESAERDTGSVKKLRKPSPPPPPPPKKK